MAKIIHFRENCIGCGACVENSPSYFEMSDKDGKAILKRSYIKNNVHVSDILHDEIEANKEALQNCPCRIIHMYDDSGEEIK